MRDPFGGELSESDHICWVDDTVCESCSVRAILHHDGNHSRCDLTSDCRKGN